MEQKHAKFAEEVDRLVRAAEEDTADALCRLSLAQQAFDRAAEDMRLRLGQVPELPQSGPAEPLASTEDLDPLETLIPARLLQLFWLVLVSCSMAAFGIGFWIGREMR